MGPDLIGVLGFAAFVLMIFLRVPVAVALGIAGAVGYGVINEFSTLGFVLGSATFDSI